MESGSSVDIIFSIYINSNWDFNYNVYFPFKKIIAFCDYRYCMNLPQNAFFVTRSNKIIRKWRLTTRQCIQWTLFFMYIRAPVFGTLNAINYFQISFGRIIVITYENIARCNRPATYGVITNHSTRWHSMGFSVKLWGAEFWYLPNTGALTVCLTKQHNSGLAIVTNNKKIISVLL